MDLKKVLRQKYSSIHLEKHSKTLQIWKNKIMMIYMNTNLKIHFRPWENGYWNK